LKPSLEEILVLAPDASSAQRGKALATIKKWSNLGATPDLVWGDCEGSGSKPYNTGIDLTRPAFKCTCPSRQFPCKHGIALYILWATEEKAFTAVTPPEALLKWQESFKAKAETKAAVEITPEKQQKREKQKKATEEKRSENVKEGLATFMQLLTNCVRVGMVQTHNKLDYIAKEQSSRLVDAQAATLASTFQRLAAQNLPEEQTLLRLGELYALCLAWNHAQVLPEALQADVRTLISSNVRKENLISADVKAETWLVAGVYQYDEQRLEVRCVWLINAAGQVALILDFKYGIGGFEGHFVLGQLIDAEVIYYPSAWPQRAVLGRYTVNNHDAFKTTPHSTFDSILDTYAQALANNPWLLQMGALLYPATLIYWQDKWWLVDENEALVPLPTDMNEAHWTFHCYLGGHLGAFFGEWNGQHFKLCAAFDAQSCSMFI
jgi:hypothetical protein